MSDSDSCSASEPFALQVIGDDMAPEFNDGQVVVVDPGGLVKDGCFVVVKTNQGILLRQYFKADERYRLCTLNPAGKIIHQTDLNDIVGIVSQRTGQRRREFKRYDI